MMFITKNSEETQRIAEEFAKTLRGAELIALYGDLGAGKTTFVQGLAKGLGIEQRIISPTFVLMRSHRIKNPELRIKNFYHVDLYRLESISDIKSLGLDELFDDKENIIAIEWAEKMKELLPKKRIDIFFKPLTGEERELRVVEH